ncbi:MAG: RimK family alpha-L-glutamate ligase [Thermoplasmata archaeon]|nr:RimK family alpha-L-glutamate ligase [Thermoplasmata archaeon]
MRGAFVSSSYLHGAKFSQPREMFLDAAERAGIQLDCFGNADLAFPVGDAEAAKRVLGDADFVLFWDKDVRCARNLELCGYLVMNSAECIGTCDDKSLTHLALSGAGVPSIDTVSCPMSFGDYPGLGFLDAAESALGYPMVVKDCFGSFGEQVALARDRAELESLMAGPYRPRILQRYIECGGRDIRVEVVGGAAVAAMERRAPEGDFRSNATIGGTVSAHTPSAEEGELAVAACEAVGADFAGVDIIRAGDGPVVCEVNSNAHLMNLRGCTGIDVSDIILRRAAERARR